MINTTKQFMTEATIAMKLTSYPILLWVLNYTQIDKESFVDGPGRLWKLRLRTPLGW
jgi:hypothetical protein